MSFSFSSSASPRVGVDDVEAWRVEVGKLEAQIGDLRARQERLKAQVAAAEALFAILMPDQPPKRTQGFETALAENAQAQGRLMLALKPADPRAFANSPPARRNYGRLTFVEAVEQALKEAAQGRLSTHELREIIEQTELGPKLTESDKGFYHAISRLAARGELVKHNGWLFVPDRYKSYMSEVELGLRSDEAAPTHSTRRSPLADAIKRALAEAGEMTSSEVIDYLIAIPEFEESLTQNKTGAYNVLSRLVGRGELVKDGGTYSLPSAEKKMTSQPDDGEVI